MAGSLFWLSDEAWERIEPHLPKNQAGARRGDDRRVISGIIHILKYGGGWVNRPSEYGPSTTIYNRWNRWSRRGLWRRLFATLSAQGPLDERAMLNANYVKAHRSAHGGKGGEGAGHRLSRGGQTTRIHAVCDLLGRPVALKLTPGNT